MHSTSRGSRARVWRALAADVDRLSRAMHRCRPARTAAPAGPPTIEVVKVVEQPLERDVVAAGRVDSLSDGRALFASDRLREDDCASIADRASARASNSPCSRRPSWSRRSPRRSRSCRARKRSSRPSDRRPRRTRARTRSLKAASATPGVVAGNDVVLAQKAVEADQAQIAAAQQNVEAARQALKSDERHGRVTCGSPHPSLAS